MRTYYWAVQYSIYPTHNYVQSGSVDHGGKQINKPVFRIRIRWWFNPDPDKKLEYDPVLSRFGTGSSLKKTGPGIQGLTGSNKDHIKK